MLKYPILKNAIKTDRYLKTIVHVLTYLLGQESKHPNTLEVVNVNWYYLEHNTQCTCKSGALRRFRATNIAVQKQYITYSEGIFVALGIQNSMLMCHIVINGLSAMLRSSIAHCIICTRLFRGKMHSEWFNEIEILQGRWQHVKKWDTVTTADLKRLFVSGKYIPRWSRKG
jgi:hypothetical protein